jgi:hypothetical protein
MAPYITEQQLLLYTRFLEDKTVVKFQINYQYFTVFFFMAQKPLLCQGLLNIEAS